MEDWLRDLIRRIERLNRSALRHSLQKPSSAWTPRTQESVSTGGAEGLVSPPDGVAASYVRLEDAVPGVEVTSPLGGKVYLISSALDDIDSSLTPLCGMLSTALNNPNAAAFRLLRRAGRSEVPDVQSILFLDLETTGLASVPLFLIGTMLWENGSLVVQQYLARDYSEEKHAIALLAEELENRRLLVSFNGKSFDLPFVENRAVAHRLEIPRPWGHLDLLHEARRVWGRRLPNCKLKTLESHILGRVRWDDIPSSEIPDAYHRFVRTGNAVEMVRIIKHNMRDLVTMAELLLQLPDHD